MKSTPHRTQKSGFPFSGPWVGTTGDLGRPSQQRHQREESEKKGVCARQGERLQETLPGQHSLGGHRWVSDGPWGS